jgi:phosphatidyl-myo-inositol dimannoside synthase
MVVDGNSPDAIAQALARLASDADLRRRMGASARAFAAENFSWDRHCRLATDGLLAPREAAPQVRPAASASG